VRIPAGRFEWLVRLGWLVGLVLPFASAAEPLTVHTYTLQPTDRTQCAHAPPTHQFPNHAQGAYKGRGRGNAFLNDLCDADCLIHVVDVSGTTDTGAGGSTGCIAPALCWHCVCITVALCLHCACMVLALQ